MARNVKIGCCGFPRSKQEYYTRFSLVEIQSTFYHLPKPETAQKWREAAPQDFEFTLKAWQGITHLTKSPTYRKIIHKIPPEVRSHYGHFRNTEQVFDAWLKTKEIAEQLRASLILFQCPPDFQETEQAVADLHSFFSRIPKTSLRMAIEFRSPWREETVRALCRDYGLIHCVDPFKERALCGEVIYFRLHGKPPGRTMYRYTYTDDDLQRLVAWIDESKPTYILFNNTNMWRDALRFMDLLNGGKHAN